MPTNDFFFYQESSEVYALLAHALYVNNQCSLLFSTAAPTHDVHVYLPSIGCGGIFNDYVIENFPRSVPVKIFF